MKKLITFLIVTFALALIFVTRANAQMMGFTDNQVTKKDVAHSGKKEGF